MDFEHRNGNRPGPDAGVGSKYSLFPDESYVGRCAAHVEGEQLRNAGQPRDALGGGYAARGARQQQVHGAAACGGRTHGAPGGLHDCKRCRFDRAFKSFEVAAHARPKACVEPGCNTAFVFAGHRQNVGRGAYVDVGECFFEGARNPRLVRGIAP